MNCHQVQTNLSLYLYGELEFAAEEELEQHLESCSFCQLALSREKAWHTKLNGERQDVPLDLLGQCRRDLRMAMKSPEVKNTRPRWQLSHILGSFDFGGGQWSKRLAFASFFLFAGFGFSNLMDRVHLGSRLGVVNEMQIAALNNPISRIRDIQPGANNQVRIVFDRVQEQEVMGSIQDEAVRRLLLTAIKDPADPGLRVDSVELLKGQDGTDIRDALLYAVRHDENAAVRLKALEGLRRFQNDRATHEVLRSVLQYDSNPAVRSEAIDVLAPINGPLRITPELAGTLEEIARSERDDDYLRARCWQVLRTAATPRAY
jgi:HEAT repeats/Putative zinc-finger